MDINYFLYRFSILPAQIVDKCSYYGLTETDTGVFILLVCLGVAEPLWVRLLSCSIDA